MRPKKRSLQKGASLKDVLNAMPFQPEGKLLNNVVHVRIILQSNAILEVVENVNAKQSLKTSVLRAKDYHGEGIVEAPEVGEAGPIGGAESKMGKIVENDCFG